MRISQSQSCVPPFHLWQYAAKHCCPWFTSVAIVVNTDAVSTNTPNRALITVRHGCHVCQQLQPTASRRLYNGLHDCHCRTSPCTIRQAALSTITGKCLTQTIDNVVTNHTKLSNQGLGYSASPYISFIREAGTCSLIIQNFFEKVRGRQKREV